MIQRVGIAQALVNDPDLVIFDEPMSGLDPIGRRDVRALILGLRDRGCTVFFSSHVLSDAEALCNRVAILAKGRLITSGRLTDMLALRKARLQQMVKPGCLICDIWNVFGTDHTIFRAGNPQPEPSRRLKLSLGPVAD